jgi:hypothetical protein
LCLLASKLAGSADCISLFPRRFFGRLLVKSSALHFAKNTLALHLLLKYAKGLVDVVVANEYLQETFLSYCSSNGMTPLKDATTNSSRPGLSGQSLRLAARERSVPQWEDFGLYSGGKSEMQPFRASTSVDCAREVA